MASRSESAATALVPSRVTISVPPEMGGGGVLHVTGVPKSGTGACGPQPGDETVPPSPKGNPGSATPPLPSPARPGDPVTRPLVPAPVSDVARATHPLARATPPQRPRTTVCQIASRDLSMSIKLTSPGFAGFQDRLSRSGASPHCKDFAGRPRRG